MDRNVGGADRIGRVILAAILLSLGYRHRQHTLGTLAFIAGSDLLATTVIQRCPVNAVLGINTVETDAS
ncbi:MULTISPECIES: DUF2892 domain-containing protein [Natrinema]|uniref:Inner membrane protein YgaP-like transmembrane domain-containing protein n=1 Tax=Natrinema gari JCM 14663 TaxID=1230459 RepID=L9Z156_9EURY|nr:MULTISPECIES: DUF2892 domain-containing protein [Natrinema]AFO55767.1 hypothetical protein NJ7G_0513 [Natrinema sp. J7-2]ELY79636.1 hypothetical protein C486_11564 [Natrinema gari JCM 14663]